MKLIGSEAAYIIDNARISQNAIFMHHKERREFERSVRNTKYLACGWLPLEWIDWLLWKLRGDLANEDNSAFLSPIRLPMAIETALLLEVQHDQGPARLCIP